MDNKVRKVKDVQGELTFTPMEEVGEKPPESKRSKLKVVSSNLLGSHGLAPANSSRLL
jgi:hypothetical protein